MKSTAPCLLLASALSLLLAAPSPGVSEAESKDGTVTFSRDVAPILAENCVSCHRPGEIAPMSLMTYEEARPWAKSIRRKVANGEMPPWGASPEHGTFTNDLSLDPEEIATVVKWVDEGARAGNPAHMPDMPAFPQGWTLGEPDYVIELDPVEVPAEGEDLFPEILVDLDLGSDRWLRAIEFLPGDRKVLHHILAVYAPRGAAANGDAGGIFGVWVAGSQPTVFPPGMGRVLRKPSRLRFNSHYHPSGKAATDRTKIGLYFGRGELRKEVTTAFGANTGFLIPAGHDNYKVDAFHLLDQDSRLVSFMPHMHMRGKSMSYHLVYPDGGRKTLLDVSRYDYNWQWIYYPTETVSAPAGSRVEVIAHFDNSEGNLSNPDPTATIPYRGDTFMEMMVGFFEFVPEHGVHPEPLSIEEKIARLLADHPPGTTFQVGGFLPMGIYLPRQGEGMIYVVSGGAMFSISLATVTWEEDRVTAHTSLPTPEASGVSAVIEGTVNDQGQLVGQIHIGVEEAEADPNQRPMHVPVLGQPG